MCRECVCVGGWPGRGVFRCRWLPCGVRVFMSDTGFLVQRATRDGYVFYCRWVPVVWGDHDDFRSPVYAACCQEGGAQVNKKSVAIVKGGPAASVDGMGKIPSLAEWMTATTFDDGADRQTPTVTFWCAGGEWHANLRDRAEGLCLWLVAPTWAELVKLCDQMCQESSAPWRRDAPGDKDKGKRVKSS